MAKRMAVKKSPRNTSQSRRFNFALPSYMPRLVAGCFIFIAIILAVYWLIRLPSVTSVIWPIEKVSFAGESKRVNKAQLISQLALHKNKGMLSIDLNQVREQVLTNPWISSAEVRKQWPDTLVFTLVENQPLALLNDGYLMPNGELVAGPVFEQDKNELLNIGISRFATEKLKAGLNSTQRHELIGIANTLHSVEQRLANNNFSVAEIEVDETNSWVITTSADVKIKLGRKNQLQRLERFLQVYVAIENKSQLSSIDLRYRNGLAVELKSEVTSKEIKTKS
jgi:cell division protein FtsQ